MLRRLLLGLTFVAAFTTVGVGFTDTAEAWRRWGWGYSRPYVSYYYGPPRAYYYNRYVPYRAYYGPRYYRPYYGGYYYGGPGYYYGPRSGVSVSFGF
jgi:hypothetical protein